MIQTAERASQASTVDNYVYQRCLFAYHECRARLSGRVLEIGTGSGLGLEVLAGACDELVTIDKYATGLDLSVYPNVHFIQMEIPPLKGLADDSFDHVISFQVIEHIEDDAQFLQEISRVLKPGGTAILTTPNRLQSLTRNPWHVREYTGDELERLMLGKGFSKVERLGTYGSKKVNEYIDLNKKSVHRITRFDIFKLQYRLPRKWLQIPYDLFNRLNRNMIAGSNESLNSSISTEDFFTGAQNDECLDLFFIGMK